MHVLGHRGSPGFPRFAENTLSSFRKALDEGASGFELDVRRCADGTLIVLHDATIDRTTNGSGLACVLSYPELARFDAGHGDSIPRLTDVLSEFGGHCTINLELKEAGLGPDVAAVSPSRVVISAFEEHWSELKAIAHQVPVALLVSTKKLQNLGVTALVDEARRIGARGLHPPCDIVSSHFVEIARKADLPVRVWTVNDPVAAIRFRDLGVETIISDFPKVCLKALGQ